MITDINGTFTLRNGVEMPYLGLGVFDCSNTKEAVLNSFDVGYRHIDTASMYRNEYEVGQAIKQSGINREELFIVSKVWNTDHGYESTLKAYERSLEKLNLNYLDLYLIHWPVKESFVETWRALEHLYKIGKVKAIGVSNFLKEHLEQLIESSVEIPMVNQMEFHPYLLQQDLVDFCSNHQIQYEAWAPLMRGKVLQIKDLQNLGIKYSKDPVQIVLRWHLQKGVIPIPKSSRKSRIFSNADIFDFELLSIDMERIDSLDIGKRFGPHPNSF